MSNYVGGSGPIRAKLMAIGEAPGKVEDEKGIPFVGPSGELFNEFLHDSGIEREEVYATNVLKHRPPENDFARMAEVGEDLEKARALLWEEINAIKPNCILALGEQALRAVAGKNKIGTYRGSILPTIDGMRKVVGTYHPANLLYSSDEHSDRGLFKYAYKYVILNDFKRAVQQSKFEGLRLPERSLEICHNSMQFFRFVDRIYEIGRTSVDIEAFHCIPDMIAFSAGRKEAMSVPLFNKMSSINYDGIPPTDLAHIWKAIYDLLLDPKIKKIGQNFKYDEPKLNGLGFFLDELWGDTLILAHVINPEIPEKNLAFLSSIYTEEPYYKSEGKEFNPKKDDYSRKLLYNAKDAAVTDEVHEEMYEEAREKGLIDAYHTCYMPRHCFYSNLESVGFRVSNDKRQELFDKYILLYNTVHSRVANFLGFEVNVNSPAQMIRVVYEFLHLPKRFKIKRHPKTGRKIRVLSTDEETLTALMANSAKKKEVKNVLADFLDERKIRKTISTYILAKADYDGRMRTSYNIVGTETDRTSTSNISAPIRPEKSMGIAFQTLTKHGDVGADICEMFIPDEGMVFLNADGAQAEARVVAVLAEDWDLLKKIDSPDYDLHWEIATWIFDELPSIAECLKKFTKDDMRRFIGKTCRHAGNLGIKKHTLMMNVNTDAKKYGYDINISEWKAGKYLEAFHAHCPNIRGVFHKTIEETLNLTRVLEGPLLYDPLGNKMKRGRWRMFFNRWGDDLFKEAYAEIPQHVVSNNTKNAGMRVARRLPELKFLLEGHDSLLVQCPLSEANNVRKVMKEEMERPIDFRSGTFKRDYDLVIPADFSIGEKNLKEMVKYVVN